MPDGNKKDKDVFVHYGRIELELCAPVTPKGLETLKYNYDLSVLRDHNGNPIISGDQLEGYSQIILSQMADDTENALPELSPTAPARKLPNKEQIRKWFGSERVRADDADHKAVLQDRAVFKIDDCVLQTDVPSHVEPTQRIQLGSDTRSAVPGAYQVIERTQLPGASLCFAGQFRFIGTKEQAESLTIGLKTVAEFIKAVGSMKTVGHGRVKSITVEGIDDIQSIPISPPAVAEECDDFVELELQPLGCFLVEPEIVDGNVYISKAEVSGALLKGSLARQLLLAGCLDEFAECLSAMGVSPAFPSASGSTRPEVIPNSTVICGDTITSLFLPQSDSKENRLIAYPGYKSVHQTKFSEKYPGIFPNKHLKVRTAVDASSWTAKQSALFSQNLITPTDGISWFTRISINDPSLKPQFQRLVTYLKDIGFLTVGKTQAEFKCVGSKGVAPVELPRDDVNEAFVILQSNAWLLQLPQDSSVPSKEAYSAAFQNAVCHAKGELPKSLRIVELYTSEYLSGGDRAMRYPILDDAYFPYFMTGRGSIFHLEWGNGDRKLVCEAMKIFQKQGLPLGKDYSWKNCPFVRENGFGEVTIVATADETLLPGAAT